MIPPVVLAIIPVRGRDPEAAGGDAVQLGGKPLLAHTIEAARASRLISRIVVSTDDARVAELAKRLGAEAPFLRPPELTAPDASLAQVLQHALGWLERHESFRADLVVLLEITHPLRPDGLIDQAIEVLVKEELETVFVAREERHEFWTMSAHGQLERVHGREGMSRELRRPLYKEMGGMVTVMRAELIRAGKRLGDRVGLVPVRDATSMVDWHDEGGPELARLLWQAREAPAAEA
jgi:N-acylneuraminate cytidylyltransferase/CMP-N,N'-diacetyllegionaminic acid synthase